MEKTEIEKEDYENERKKNSNVEYVMKEVYAQDNETPLDIAAAHNVLIKELLLANAHIKHLKPTALLFEGTVIIVPTNETIVREKNNNDNYQDEDDQNDDLGDDIFGVSSDDSDDSGDRFYLPPGGVSFTSPLPSPKRKPNSSTRKSPTTRVRPGQR